MEKTKAALMVVASLIATMAFQIRVNPPGGVWQDDNTKDKLGNPVEAGSSIFAHKYQFDYELFYIINTVAFIASLSIILLLMSGFRFGWRFFAWLLMFITWVVISAIAMCYVYAIAVLTLNDKRHSIAALTPDDKRHSIVHVIKFTTIVWLVLMALILIAHTIRLIVMGVKKMRKTFRPKSTSLV